VRTQLSALTVRGQADLSPDAYQTEYNRLLQAEKQLETELSSRSATFQVIDAPVSLEQVQAQIPPDAVLIEFVQYRPVDWQAPVNQMQGEPHYAAYVLPPSGAPIVVGLGPVSDIDPVLNQFRTELQNDNQAKLGQTDTVNQTGQTLHDLLFAPLKAAIGEADHLLLAPDGPLNLIPFEALVDSQGRYLIERYATSYLTSGRDLLRQQEDSASQQPPWLVANPAYASAIASAPAAESQQVAVANQSKTNNQRSSDLSLLSFSDLEGTQEEANDILPLLQRRFNAVELLTQTQATEARVKQMQSPIILHIATHGFFLPDEEIELIPEFSFETLAPTARQFVQVENPLLRSGLALAGANPPRPSPESNQADGILTALEVANLDLSGTQLVVLSACETGVGEARTGDGVYGLRRALTIAGSQSQIMSLWKVDDDVTRDLMVAYYSNLLNDDAPLGRHESLRQAQQTLLNNPQTRHPYFWAAFIPSGDWRPIQ